VQRAIAAAASEREREALQQLARHRFRALESHGDCVSTLPPGAVNLAASEHTVNEIYMIGSKLLGACLAPLCRRCRRAHALACPWCRTAVQFHPEFNIDDVRTIIAPAVEGTQREHESYIDVSRTRSLLVSEQSAASWTRPSWPPPWRRSNAASITTCSDC